MRTLTPKEAAELIGVDRNTLYKWSLRGKIRFVSDGITPTGQQRRRYPIADVFQFVAQRALLTTSQVTEVLGVHRRTIRRWVMEGRLIPVQTHEGNRYRQPDIERIKAEREAARKDREDSTKQLRKPPQKQRVRHTLCLKLGPPLQPVPLDPNWTRRAACLGEDTEMFFAQSAGQEAGKYICKDCPVRYECLADALDSDVRYGLFGGMTDRERRRLMLRNPGVTSWRKLFSGKA